MEKFMFFGRNRISPNISDMGEEKHKRRENREPWKYEENLRLPSITWKGPVFSIMERRSLPFPDIMPKEKQFPIYRKYPYPLNVQIGRNAAEIHSVPLQEIQRGIIRT